MSAIMEALQLKIDILGEEEFAAAIATCEQALKDLYAQFGSMKFGLWDAQTGRIIDKLELLKEKQIAAAAATAAATGQANANTAATGANTAATGANTAATGANTAAHEKWTVTAKQARQSMVALSYAAQDFASTSGDLGAKLNSVTNNVPAILNMFGGWGTALSLVAVGLVAVYRNSDWVMSFFEERHAFENQATEVDQLTSSLKKVNKELDELKKRQSLNRFELDHAKALQAEQDRLESLIKTQKKIDNLKEKRSDFEEKVVKAFEQALSDVGPKKALNDLKADLSESAIPGYKNLFLNTFKLIEEGNLDAYHALIDYTKTNPAKYKELTDQLELALKEVFHPKNEGDMDKIVEELNTKRKKLIVTLNNHGAEVETKMREDLNKEVNRGVMAIYKKSLEEMVIRGRDEGVKGKKELDHLRNILEDQAQRLFPKIAANFPKVIQQTAAAMQVAITEAVDRSVELLREAEGLTTQEAIRRLRQAQQEKGQKRAEDLALDEFKQAAARDLVRQKVLHGAPANPEMAKQQSEAFQKQLDDAGVSAIGQVGIGKALNMRGGKEAIAQAMDALQGMGVEEGEALRQLPSMLDQMAQGRRAQQAAADLMNRAIRREAAAANFEAVEAARPPVDFAKQRPRGNGFRSVPPAAPPDFAAAGLNAQQQTQQAVFDAQQNIAALSGQIRIVEANNAQLARNNAMLRQQIQMPGPPNLAMGAP